MAKDAFTFYLFALTLFQQVIKGKRCLTTLDGHLK